MNKSNSNIAPLRQALKYPGGNKPREMPKRLLSDRQLKQAEEALKIMRTILKKCE